MAVEQHLHRFPLEFVGVDAALGLGWVFVGFHGSLLGCQIRVNLSSRSVHKSPYTSVALAEHITSALRAFTNSMQMRFVLVPKGTFWMGGGGGKPGDEPYAIPHDFYIGVYPVTQGQWQELMGNNPSWFLRTGEGKAKVKNMSDTDLRMLPVENVSWEDAQTFLERLNAREKGREWVYRLPTAAEWEYACRGGATSKEGCSYHFYLEQPSSACSSVQANFDGNHPVGGAPKGPNLERTSKVGSYPPNRLGICDLHGNVWEWCEDSDGPASHRVIRGGSWGDRGSDCQAAHRGRYARSSRCHYLGFRVARVPSGR
jgi:formylglycine-generating enzyme required for sulfatase activity